MVLCEGHGTPMVAQTESATPHEVKLIEPMLVGVRVPKLGRGRPKKRLRRLIYDGAADSDPLRKRLKLRGTDLICPHRSNRVKPPLQDGRKLRRYRRRWKIERTISWIQDFRRLVVRYDHKISMFNAYLQLACLTIAMRQL
jgi:transposase